MQRNRFGIANKFQIETLNLHAMLVTWCHFAQGIKLIIELGTIPLRRMDIINCPNSNLKKFLISIMYGLKNPKELSQAAHPTDQ